MIKFNRQFDPHSIKLLIFDLDGTLIDSRLDLVHSVNAMLRHFGRPELPDEVVASYVGDGAPVLVRRALGDPKDQKFLKEALDYFLAYYRIHKLDHTHVYEGIRESLAAIQGSNGVQRKMAVLSKKPDPEGARSLLKETKTRAQDAAIIGDSSVDVLTGRNAGMWTCGVTYGFAPHTLCEAPPDVVVDKPKELAALFA